MLTVKAIMKHEALAATEPRPLVGGFPYNCGPRVLSATSFHNVCHSKSRAYMMRYLKTCIAPYGWAGSKFVVLSTTSRQSEINRWLEKMKFKKFAGFDGAHGNYKCYLWQIVGGKQVKEKKPAKKKPKKRAK